MRIPHIDCASVYGNEAEVGEALRELFEEGVVTREELWITSKLWNDHHEKGRVEEALRNTLSDLGLDYLDLYLVHWPVALRYGTIRPETAEDVIPLSEIPLAETWSEMERAVVAGLARRVGVSNFSVAKLRRLVESGAGASNQPSTRSSAIPIYDRPSCSSGAAKTACT